jgi:methionyl-tRNA formyltransferase
LSTLFSVDGLFDDVGVVAAAVLDDEDDCGVTSFKLDAWLDDGEIVVCTTF